MCTYYCIELIEYEKEMKAKDYTFIFLRFESNVISTIKI